MNYVTLSHLMNILSPVYINELNERTKTSKEIQELANSLDEINDIDDTKIINTLMKHILRNNEDYSFYTRLFHNKFPVVSQRCFHFREQVSR